MVAEYPDRLMGNFSISETRTGCLSASGTKSSSKGSITTGGDENEKDQL